MTSTLTRSAAALAVAALPLIAGGTAAQAGTDHQDHNRDRGHDYCRDHQHGDYRSSDHLRTNGFEDPPARMTIPRYGDTSHHRGDYRGDHCRPPQKPPTHHNRHHQKRHHLTLLERQLRELRSATAAYFSVTAAQAAGYARPPAPNPLHYCIAQDPRSNKAPAMGIHWINNSLVDAKVELTKPEALVYEPTKDGKLDFVAVEYVVPKDAWTKAGNTMPPKLFGQEFMLTTSPNRYNLPAFYSLHVWVWKYNPAGLFAPFNPLVSCVYADRVK